MNAAFAHRLLSAPTNVWTDYQKTNPQWGRELSNCLRAGTVSPIAITKNLRKLTDCLADVDVQPLLCKWMANMLISSGDMNDTTQRMQYALSKCVRGIQLHAIAQGSNINILPKMAALFELTGEPLSSESLWEHTQLKKHDIYSVKKDQDGYFSQGYFLGDKTACTLVLSQYQQYMLEAMLGHYKLRDYPENVDFESTVPVANGKTTLAHALLWRSDLLEDSLKYALCIDWLRNTNPWATRVADETRCPEQTQQWRALAAHAEMYLTVAGQVPASFYETRKMLKSCPPMIAQKVDYAVDSAVFDQPPP